MIELYPRLYVGDQSTCTKGHEDLAVVHACKSPCHQEAAEYHGSLPPDHLYYLVVEHEHDQFLNLIDPPTPLFQVASFLYFRDFAARTYMMHGQHRCGAVVHTGITIIVVVIRNVDDTSLVSEDVFHGRRRIIVMGAEVDHFVALGGYHAWNLCLRSWSPDTSSNSTPERIA